MRSMTPYAGICPSPDWGLERIPLGGATIDLLHCGDGRIRVVSNRAFTLEVIDGEVVRRKRFPAGRWELATADMETRPTEAEKEKINE